MRRIYRSELSLSTRMMLRKRQASCDSSISARNQWKSFRQSSDSKPVVDALSEMAGSRARCFYCSDSLASDIEHFFPVTPDYGHTFSWPNLLWVCAACNRRKHATYPVRDGERIFIDPTIDDPWRHITLATPTAILAPRYSAEEIPDSRGEETLKVLDVLNYDAVAEGRKRSMDRILNAAAQIVETKRSTEILAKAISEDDYGVARWFAFWEGKYSSPFNELVTMKRPWRRFLKMASHQGAA